MNWDRNVLWTITKHAEDQRRQGIMEAFQPCFHEVNIRASNGMAVLQMREVQPGLRPCWDMLVCRSKIATPG